MSTEFGHHTNQIDENSQESPLKIKVPSDEMSSPLKNKVSSDEMSKLIDEMNQLLEDEPSNFQIVPPRSENLEESKLSSQFSIVSQEHE